MEGGNGGERGHETRGRVTSGKLGAGGIGRFMGCMHMWEQSDKFQAILLLNLLGLGRGKWTRKLLDLFRANGLE